jgi:hypothetical protein
VVEVVFVVVVTLFEDFGTTFVYVDSLIVVLALFLVFLFIDFGDSPLLGSVSYRFFGLFFLNYGCMSFSFGVPRLSFVCCYLRLLA